MSELAAEDEVLEKLGADMWTVSITASGMQSGTRFYVTTEQKQEIIKDWQATKSVEINGFQNAEGWETWMVFQNVHKIYFKQGSVGKTNPGGLGPVRKK